MHDAYRDDLAYIHDVGFGRLATNAAAVVVEELRRDGAHTGLIVDLGCGGGISSFQFHHAGYDVLGVDLSAPLIEIARRRVPGAEFRVGSFVSEAIPPCVAVAAIGEVFNYGFDPANSDASRLEVFTRIFAALAPNGVLIFDVAGPDRAPLASPQRTFVEGHDWAVLTEIEAGRERSVLMRRITTFRKLGDLYRRNMELHRLQLVESAYIVDSLYSIGFRVQKMFSYGSISLPRGLVGFLARKPR
jgi:SAM-dependent methyltransferase